MIVVFAGFYTQWLSEMMNRRARALEPERPQRLFRGDKCLMFLGKLERR